LNSIHSKYDVIIVGGGLAGLCSAIHLSKKNISVLLIEKNEYPKHKVCGEYISNEVLPYLSFLGINIFELGSTKINSFEISSSNNQLLTAPLGLGGFGISRYCLDHALVEIAIDNQVTILKDSVENIQFSTNIFGVTTKTKQTLQSKIVIGAYGKRANLDLELNRNFIKKKSPYLAVKTYIKGDFPNNLVALHNFKGGYCGVSKVEDDKINVCYITSFNIFKKYKNIDDFQQQVVFKNTYLKALFKNSKQLLERQYSKQWNAEFKLRLQTGHIVANLFQKNKLAELSICLLKHFPSLLPLIIKRTHGKTMTVK